MFWFVNNKVFTLCKIKSMMKKEQELQYHEKVKLAMDSRRNNWLSEKTGIHASEISRILKGRLIPTEKQKEKIRNAFPHKVNF